MLPKLSVAGDLSYSSRYTVPHTRSCDSETFVAESGTCAWNSQRPVGRCALVQQFGEKIVPFWQQARNFLEWWSSTRRKKINSTYSLIIYITTQGCKATNTSCTAIHKKFIMDWRPSWKWRPSWIFFFKWPHMLSFLIDERLSSVKISCLLPKWHNSPPRYAPNCWNTQQWALAILKLLLATDYCKPSPTQFSTPRRHDMGIGP